MGLLPGADFRVMKKSLEEVLLKVGEKEVNLPVSLARLINVENAHN